MKQAVSQMFWVKYHSCFWMDFANVFGWISLMFCVKNHSCFRFDVTTVILPVWNETIERCGFELDFFMLLYLQEAPRPSPAGRLFRVRVRAEKWKGWTEKTSQSQCKYELIINTDWREARYLLYYSGSFCIPRVTENKSFFP